MPTSQKRASRGSPQRDTTAAIRELLLALPQVEELTSHGSPNYRVKSGKIFATYARNHHGDGRIALWLKMPSGAQESYVSESSRHFFVPPYVGPRGWLGVRLDRGLAWTRVANLARMAYEQVAPAKLVTQLKSMPRVAPPIKRLTLADVDPKNTPQGKRVLAAMRAVCLVLPDTTEGEQFGQPVWRVGKRVFAQAYCYETGWRIAFWVGIPSQALMTRDRRFSIPQYLGPYGWIALDATGRLSQSELQSLARDSYKHYASRRQLARIQR